MVNTEAPTLDNSNKLQSLDELSAVAADGSQYLTFQLMQEEYGLNILQVQEIKNFSHITPIPNTPDYIKGAMNLRGTVVPIVDLRLRFNMPDKSYDQYTVIIVVNIGSRVVGLVVDAVNDVLNIRSDDWDPTPDLGADVDTSFIRGLAKQEDRLITLLNIDSLVDIQQLNQTSSEDSET